jgi:hypothetical protein
VTVPSDSSCETVQVAVDDLLELMAIAEAGEYVSTFFNNDDPIPAWEATGWTIQGIRERCFPDSKDLDDYAFDKHPAIGRVQDRAAIIAAGILQSMLDDEREFVGMAGLFDTNLTRLGEWPCPLHQVRRAMRDQIKTMTAMTAIAAKRQSEAVDA